MMKELDEIIALDGMCIFGKPEHQEESDEVKKAYRDGSADAYAECADLARAVKTYFDTLPSLVDKYWA